MNTYSVYIHIVPNGKKYVGLTRNSPEFRWRNGTGYSRSLFGNAVKKYGWENIRHGIFAEGLSFEEAEEMEKALIAQLHTLSTENGYNVTEGGNASNHIMTKEERERMSRKKMGANNPRSKPVRCLQNGVIYESVRIAAKELGLEKTNILRVLSGRNTHTGGYTFEYVRECDCKPKKRKKTLDELKEPQRKKTAVYNLDGELIGVFKSRKEAAEFCGVNVWLISDLMKHRHRRGNYMFRDAIPDTPQTITSYSEIKNGVYRYERPVDCFDLDGNFLKHFNSAALAARELNCDNSTILKVCKGMAKSHKGYIFRFVNPQGWEEMP